MFEMFPFNGIHSRKMCFNKMQPRMSTSERVDPHVGIYLNNLETFLKGHRDLNNFFIILHDGKRILIYDGKRILMHVDFGIPGPDLFTVKSRGRQTTFRL